jgi:hypothetical protein
MRSQEAGIQIKFRTALITGSSRGLGRQIAVKLAAPSVCCAPPQSMAFVSIPQWIVTRCSTKFGTRPNSKQHVRLASNANRMPEEIRSLRQTASSVATSLCSAVILPLYTGAVEGKTRLWANGRLLFPNPIVEGWLVTRDLISSDNFYFSLRL